MRVAKQECQIRHIIIDVRSLVPFSLTGFLNETDCGNNNPIYSSDKDDRFIIKLSQSLINLPLCLFVVASRVISKTSDP